jgi:mannose-1-phosphate guanylyltransferase
LQALILVGGEGTRLRPLTSTLPKPIVPLVGQPFLSYMLRWLSSHGVDDVILSCGFMAAGVKDVLGDGSRYGVSLRYVEEPLPLGTGGALKYAEKLLDERFFMLNGDTLTDIDLSAALAQHERTGARATIALVPVEDPSAYGLVRLAPDDSVEAFLEKPGAGEIDTNTINAGAYVLQRDVLAGMAPAGSKISIERDVFPELVGGGLYGYRADGYWLDIGTPERYLQATFDILDGAVHTDVGEALRAAHALLVPSDVVSGRLLPPVVMGEGCLIEEGARIGSHAVLGAGVSVGPGTRVEGSVLLDDVTIGAGTTIRGAIIGPRCHVGDDCLIESGAMLGEGVRIGRDNVIAASARIFPDVELPDGTART